MPTTATNTKSTDRAGTAPTYKYDARTGRPASTTTPRGHPGRRWTRGPMTRPLRRARTRLVPRVLATTAAALHESTTGYSTGLCRDRHGPDHPAGPGQAGDWHVVGPVHDERTRRGPGWPSTPPIGADGRPVGGRAGAEHQARPAADQSATAATISTTSATTRSARSCPPRFGPFGTQLVQDYTYDAGTSRLLQVITNLQTLSQPPTPPGPTIPRGTSPPSPTRRTRRHPDPAPQPDHHRRLDRHRRHPDRVAALCRRHRRLRQHQPLGRGPAPYWETRTTTCPATGPRTHL